MNLLVATARVCAQNPTFIPSHLESLLSDDELHRASGIKDVTGRADFMLGRALLRYVLCGVLPVEPRHLPIHIEKNGRPFLMGHDLEFSLSHSCGYVCAAVSRNGKVGVDIEGVDSLQQSAVLKAYLSKTSIDYGSTCSTYSNAEIAGQWCMAEAYAKCSGKDVLSARRCEEFRTLKRSARTSDWYIGSHYSIWLASIVAGQIPLAVCIKAQPTSVSLMDIDLFDESLITTHWKKWQTT